MMFWSMKDKTFAKNLERRRHILDWPKRQRRYRINEEILTAEKELSAVEAELDALGVVMLEASTGLVGFPTMVNNRAAFFSWRPEEDGLTYWNFSGDMNRRPIPEDWTKPAQESASRARSKSRK